jgi:hypothetical protein
MFLLRAFPFLALVVIAYNVVFVFGATATGAVLGEVRLPSGVLWSISAGDVFVIVGLALLFVEILSASPRRVSVVNHGLSLLVFVVCVIEFLLVPGCGTPEFLFITLMTLVDSVGGYSISARLARRDVEIARAEQGARPVNP